MWWICLCVAIVAVLTILIFKRMPIELIYAASVKHKRQAFKVKVYSIDIIRDKSKKKEKKKLKKEKEKEKFTFSGFMQKVKWVKEIYKSVKEDIEEILKYLGKKASCRQFIIHLDLGFEDAAQTGIASGAAYGIVYGAASAIYNNLDITKEDMDIQVNPRFDKQCGDLYIKSIFYLSPAHIIKVVIMLLKINKKIKKIIKQ